MLTFFCGSPACTSISEIMSQDIVFIGTCGCRDCCSNVVANLNSKAFDLCAGLASRWLLEPQYIHRAPTVENHGIGPKQNTDGKTKRTQAFKGRSETYFESISGLNLNSLASLIRLFNSIFDFV